MRKFVRRIQDRLSGSTNEKDSTPQPIKPENRESLEKPQETGLQEERPSSVTRDHPRRQRRRRPAPENRPAASSPEVRAKTPSKTGWDLSEFQVAPAEGKTRFHDLNLPIEIMHGIYDLGFDYCTPIQAAIMPDSLAGKDVTGKAQTGTGKTAAFLITILNHMKRKPPAGVIPPGTPRALIMVPTRELALQVQKDATILGKYCRYRVAAVSGSISRPSTCAAREAVLDLSSGPSSTSVKRSSWRRAYVRARNDSG